MAPNQRHVVAVTGVDKCIRVFSLDGGRLDELSQRCMPKRPCALQITDDSETIICGDKFGDVYSLPLLPTINEVDGSATPQAAIADVQKTYEPSATETTVHTKRNLKALQEQLKSKGKVIKPTKEPLAFEHKLLLGHVSMLTDMQLVTSELGGKRRRYIITGDRDEHIRISRGIPQAHIVESYCLGHTDFIHRIRQVPGTNLLVSGGGDDWMGVWDWTTGQLLSRKGLRSLQSLHDSQDATKKPLAVSNIWAVATSESNTLIIVACEDIKALAIFDAGSLVDAKLEASIVDTSADGLTLDLIEVGDGTLILSSHPQRLRTWRIIRDQGTWSITPEVDANSRLEELNLVDVPTPDQSRLDNLLHGAERLRKRENEAEQED